VSTGEYVCALVAEAGGDGCHVVDGIARRLARADDDIASAEAPRLSSMTKTNRRTNTAMGAN
jgi:hypothetical protein